MQAAPSNDIRRGKAEYFLSVAYYGEMGVPADRQKQEYWLEVASIHGCTDAMVANAVHWYNPTSSTRDPKRAVYWFTQALSSGRADVKRWLGTCYLLGDGVERDVNRGRQLISEAAAQGDEKAQLALRKYL